METAIVTRSEMAMTVDVDSLQRMGKMLALSGYFEKSGNGDQAIAQMCTKILAGRELGFGPFAAVNGIYIIQGRPSVSANLMASAVKASGRYDYKVKQMTAEVCELEFFEIGNGKRESLGVSSFNAVEAKAAGTQNMGKFPRNMLFARAMSNGVRWYCPDVFSGNAVYVPEELGADVDQEGNVIDSTVTVREVVSTNGNGNGGGGDATTGIVKGTATPTVPAGTEVWQGWHSPAEAQVWACETGAYDNPHAARNGFKKVAGELFPGQDSCKPHQLPALYEAYYNHVQDKLEVAKMREAADIVPAGTDDNPFE
jgi:hypothetical protein